MADPGDARSSSEDARLEGDEREDRRRSRIVTALVVLLLLLLCAVFTTLDVWLNRSPDEVRFVARNVGCLQCHTEKLSAMELPAVHDPFLLQDCRTCHEPHGREIERTVVRGGYERWQRFKTLFEWLPLKAVLWTYDGVAALAGSGPVGQEISRETLRDKGQDSEFLAVPSELCWTCHGDLGPKLGMSHQHAPFANGFCTNCHDPHASDHRLLMRQDERDLCVTCHPMGPELARDQVHPPVEGRFCTNCHDPHASDWRGILVDSQRELCFRCHPSVAPLSLKAVQHNPFAFDNCTGCHEPHGSDSRPLLISGQPALCYECHPGVENDFGRPSRHPVDTLSLDCADCHDPHAADYKALLVARDNALCYECHSEARGDAQAIRATYEASDHKGTLCIGCHTPHGSDHSPILQDRNPEVCVRCHTDLDGRPNSHPYSPNYYDVVAGLPLTCTSTCHGPHGTGRASMLENYSFPMDGLCIQCHTGAGEDF